MQLVTITRSASPAVTTAEARDHLRVPGSYDDVYIAELVRAAVLRVEDITGFKLFTQTVELRMDRFPSCSEINLQCGKVVTVDSIKYDDTDDAEQTWTASNYWSEVLTNPARVVKKSTGSWPSTKYLKPSAVRVRMTAGWPNIKQIPDHFRVAIKLIIGHWYENRSDVTSEKLLEIPSGAQSILDNPLYSFKRL